MHSLRQWHTVHITRVQRLHKAVGIQHRVTSPTNVQSNGQAECFVQTIKNSLTKAMEGGEDLHLAILSYITTPLNNSLSSPAELLNSRRCLLPLQIEQQNHIQQYRKQCNTKSINKQNITTGVLKIYQAYRLEMQYMSS